MAPSPIYTFPLLTGNDTSPMVRAALRELASGSAASGENGSFIAFKTTQPSSFQDARPAEMTIILREGDGRLSEWRFCTLQPERQTELALAYALLESDPSYRDIRATAGYGHSGSSPNPRHYYFTPSAVLGVAMPWALNMHLLIDRRDPPEDVSKNIDKERPVFGLLPARSASAHERLRAEAELGELASRIAAMTFQDAKRKDQTWKEKRPQMRPLSMS